MAVPAFRNETYRNFSDPAQRQAFEKALDDVRAAFRIEAPLVIGGKRVETKKKIIVTSPSDTSLVLGASGSAGPKEMQAAIAAATAAFESWSRTTPGERARLMIEAAARMRADRDRLAALMVFEAAKPWREADADICEAIDFLEYYAREILRLGSREPLQTWYEVERNELYYAPLGVVGVIGPWNFPGAIPLGMMSAAVVAGNTTLWKPSSQTPLIAWEMLRHLEACGLPPGVVNFVPGPGTVVGEALVSSPDVHMIAFTGSKEVGLHILREAYVPRPGQQHVKRVVAEMGGKNALIVDESAALDDAVLDLVYSAFGFSGQKCSACSRLVVHRAVYDDVVARLREEAARLTIAPAWDPACRINAVIDAKARAKIEEYIALGRKEHKALFVGETGKLGKQGHYVPPAIFLDVKRDDRLAREEVFGPVLAVLKARDFDDALAIANASEYALTGGLYSRSWENLERAKRELRCGNLYLNRGITGAMVGRQPFGGFKMSGIGSKAGGPDYLRQFLVARTASENLLGKLTTPD
ncbi:MAG: L-glutamate gamma-semialdehyde dehydrogenase [Candidatus Sumerlaeia bacterium]|nr:L-glutamate gamma-semialdehyde dehydrogenase [Candidatus Sumerlaeia bacterium]